MHRQAEHLDFIDGKHCGGACLAAVAMATCYVADMNDWRFIALPLLAVLVYCVILRRPGITVLGNQPQLLSQCFSYRISVQPKARAMRLPSHWPVNYHLYEESAIPINGDSAIPVVLHPRRSL
jgi:hypothetical protein